MTAEKLAFERLKRVNPQPVVHIEDRPDPREMMSGEHLDTPTLVPTAGRTQRSSRFGPLIAAAVFALVLALGLPMLLDLDTEPTPANTGSDVVPFLTEVGTLSPGTYLVDTIGVPLTLEVPFEWWVESIAPGRIDLADPEQGVSRDAQVAPRRQMTIVRPTTLTHPPDLSGDLPVEGGWALDDIQGWLDNLEDGVSVSDVSNTTVSGYPATRFVLRLDDSYSCGVQSCARLLSSRGSGDLTLRRGTDWIIWWVDLGDGLEPLAIVSTTAGDADFRATLEQIVDSIVVGEPGPHPLETKKAWELGIDTNVPAGEVQTPAAGGIRFELPSAQFVYQHESSVWWHPSGLTVFGVFVTPRTSQGVELETVDDVTTYLEARTDLVAVDAGQSAVGAYQGRVYDITDGPVSMDAALWDFGETGDSPIPPLPPTFGKIWVADTPRGPLVVVAGTLEGDLGLEDVLDFAEEILPSIELIEQP